MPWGGPESHGLYEDSGQVLVEVAGSPAGAYPPCSLSQKISEEHGPNSRLQSFFSEVMEDREDTLILPSRNSSAGLACLRNLWYNSVWSGVNLKKRQLGQWERLNHTWALWGQLGNWAFTPLSWVQYLQQTTCSIFTGRYLDSISDVLRIRHLERTR